MFSWIKSGKKDMLSHALDKVQEILANHKPMPLTPEQEAGIEQVLKEAREYYRARGMISDEDWSEYKSVIEFAD